MKHTKFAIVSLLSLLSLAASAIAGERHFANVYETTTAAKGEFEFENWVTWKTRRGEGDNSNLWKFRHEIEYGITDRLQLGVYLANWTLTRDATHRNTTRYESAAAELIYRMSHPTTDALGSALYLEIEGGHDLFALEGKLLLQKNIGRFVFAWNGVIEAEWSGRGMMERTGTLEQTFGVSYQITPKVSVGGELVHEVSFEDWSKSGPNVLFAGPNVSWRFKRGYITAATLFQCTRATGEPDIQTRVIFGIHF
ncbi:MAG: hypothetical protein WCK55_03305 [Verrucomicrobiota bacterium]|nr:hypothetical protein [Verrucomicrobiota bacterium]